MTTDLWMLVWTALMCVLMPLVGVTGLLLLPGGPAYGFGNRDDEFDVPHWIGRVRRSHSNLVENLAPFAVLVLVAHVSGKANSTTALGATIFFWSRVAHFIIYTVGIPYARTAAFAVSVTGALMILKELF